MNKEEGTIILETGIKAVEILTSANALDASYESVCGYIYKNLKGFIFQLQLYVLDENQKVLKEKVICNYKSISPGDDLIPLYQLPEGIAKEKKTALVKERNIWSLYLPLIHNKEFFGLILVKSRRTLKNYTSYFEVLGNLMAMGIKQVLSSINNQRYRAFFNKTVEFSNILNAADSIEKLVVTFAKHAVSLNFDRVTIFVYNHTNTDKIEFGYCITSWGSELLVGEERNLPHYIKEPMAVSKKTGYWFPLLSGTRRVGLVLFDNLYSRYTIPENYLHMLTPLCSQLAASIENIRLFHDVQRAAQRDKLTDLYNRAYLETMLARLDEEKYYPLSIIIGDVNGLKITNDIFGHFEGDLILQAIAGILKKVCRKEDIVARWGGDEFVILLPRTNEERAESMIQSIKQKMKAARGTKIQLSISMGFASKESNSEGIGQVMKKAEERMYRDKLLERTYFRNTFIATLREIMHKKCQEPEEHIDRMDYLSSQLGKYMRLSDNDMEELKLLAMLHDIGKVAVRQDILNKPGKLSREEWVEIKKHSESGYRIAQASPELSRIAGFILFHHERWDGKGYPMGKKELEIPLLSRIISVIDAYDVMTHPRVYKNAVSHEEAIAELKRCSGTQFDPDIVRQFIETMELVYQKSSDVLKRR